MGRMMFVTFQVGVGMEMDENLSDRENLVKAIEIANKEFAEGIEVDVDKVIKVEMEPMDTWLDPDEKPAFEVIDGGKK